MKLLPSLAAALLAVPWTLPAQTPDGSPVPTPYAQVVPPGKGPAILIKIDDFTVGKSRQVSPQWQRVADFLRERKIKANIGVIANSLEGDNPAYFQWIKDQHASGLVEFWLHAYEHKSWKAPDGVEYNEFVHHTYEEELRTFARCQQLAREKLGFTFQTFGPPGTGVNGPSMDDESWKALAATPDLRYIYYSGPMDERGQRLEAETKLRLLTRVWKVNIEWPLFKPNSQQFEAGLAQYASGRDYFFIQGHPQHWSDEGFEEFKRIVECALAHGCTFVTAGEYAAAHPALNTPARKQP